MIKGEQDKEFERVYIRYYARMKRFAREYVVCEEEAANRMREEASLTLQMNLNSLQVLDLVLLKEENVEEKINRVITSLPEKCREIFIKSKLEGKKQKEIAAELNISVNTVETQMGIAYKKLR